MLRLLPSLLCAENVWLFCRCQMEGSAGFQGSMQAHHPYLDQPMHQPMVQNQLFQGEPSSNMITALTSDNLGELRNVFEDESHGNCLKWTDEMARLLINAVSYITEATLSEPDDDDDVSSRKLMFMPKMTKWKVISMVIGERGYNVSPQQCEDKFSEINKKYEQMIGILGKAMSCKVVENPILLDSIDMPERQKEEVRSLLSSDQFLHGEMCSLHNGNRLFLPHDWELRRSVLTSLADQEGNRNDTVRNQNGRKVLRARWRQLEEKKLEIQQQRLQFEKARFDWLCFNHDEDLKLEKMRLENERLKVENARLAFELNCQVTTILDDNN